MTCLVCRLDQLCSSRSEHPVVDVSSAADPSLCVVLPRRGAPSRPRRTGPRLASGQAGLCGPGHCWSWLPRLRPRRSVVG